MMADPPARDSDVEAFRYAVFKLFYQQAQEDKVQVDKETVFVLSELLLGYIDIFAGDLEAFCRHGKRTTITAEDVLLCCRRNDFLKGKMEKFLKKSDPSTSHNASYKKGKNSKSV